MEAQQEVELLRIKLKNLEENGKTSDGEPSQLDELPQIVDFNPTPEQSPMKADLKDMDFDNEEELNADLRAHKQATEPLHGGDYHTQAAGKLSLLQNDEDGLPTILEQSGAEPIGNPELADHDLLFGKAKSFVDTGKPSVEGYKTKQEPEFARNSDVHGLNRMTALKLQYKHRRMQSKNALFNHYRSLSLMNGDDATKILNQSGRICMDAVQNAKRAQDFDDISSIYTAANAQQEDIGRTMRRIRNRDELLSNFDDHEDIGYLNAELEHHNRIDEQEQEHDSSQILTTQEQDNKDDEILERYYSANQKQKGPAHEDPDPRDQKSTGPGSKLEALTATGNPLAEPGALDRAQSDIRLSETSREERKKKGSSGSSQYSDSI